MNNSWRQGSNINISDSQQSQAPWWQRNKDTRSPLACRAIQTALRRKAFPGHSPWPSSTRASSQGPPPLTSPAFEHAFPPSSDPQPSSKDRGQDLPSKKLEDRRIRKSWGGVIQHHGIYKQFKNDKNKPPSLRTWFLKIDGKREVRNKRYAFNYACKTYGDGRGTKMNQVKVLEDLSSILSITIYYCVI